MHRTIRLGAGIAYYGLFALIPILALSLAVAGLVVSDADVQAYLDDRLVEVFGPEAAGFSAAIASVLGESGTIVGPRDRSAPARSSSPPRWSCCRCRTRSTRSGNCRCAPASARSFLRRLGAFAVILSAGLVLIARLRASTPSPR